MQTGEIKTETWAWLGEGGAGPGELNYLSQFDIKGSDQILRRTLTENCHIHSDKDQDQDTQIIYNQLFI